MSRSRIKANCVGPFRQIVSPSSMYEVWQSGPFRCLRSRFRHPVLGAVVHLSFSRTPWQRLGWADLQSLKRAMGYGEHEAMQVFPRDADTVDLASVYHLWVLLDVALDFDQVESDAWHVGASPA